MEPAGFLGFTLEEWQRSFELGGSSASAARASAEYFIRTAPISNGYSMDEWTWVFLALVGPATEQKVRALHQDSPGLVRKIERLMRDWRAANS